MNGISRTTVVLMACIAVLVIGAVVAVLVGLWDSGAGAEKIPVVQIGLSPAASSSPQGTSSSVTSLVPSTSTQSTVGKGQTTTTGTTQPGGSTPNTSGRETVPSTLRIRVGGGGPESGPSSTGGAGFGPASTGGPASGR